MSFPGTTLFPSSTLLPGDPDEQIIGGVGVPSSAAFDPAWLEETIHDELYPGNPVGRPRVGLRPGLGQYPGAAVSGPVEGQQYPYRRIQYPSASIFPGRGLFLARTDFTPVARSGWTVIVGRGIAAVKKAAAFHSFKAVFDSPVGHLDAHGVFSSDLSGRMPHTVEMSDGQEISELSGGVAPVELASGNATVDFDSLFGFVEVEPGDDHGVDVQ